MNTLRATIALAVVGVVHTTSPAVYGQIVKYQFSGRVTTVENAPVFGIAPTLDSPISGVFSYDLSSSGGDGFDPNFETYQQNNADGLRLVVGGSTLASSLYRVNITNDPPAPEDPDLLNVIAQPVTGEELLIDGAPAGAQADLQIVLQDSSRTVFANTSLPLALDLDDFDGAGGALFDLGNGGEISFSLDSLTLIPEPASEHLAGLLIVLVGLLCGHCRNRVRTAS